MSDAPNTFASSTGQPFTGSDWLDLHFESSRPEYEAQVRAVGIQPGWHVLDAGCGTGSFLPWLADLVDSTGKLTALDFASDNVAVVEQRVIHWNLPCPVETRVDSVLALPFADDAFDALWFANTSQYLTDEELGTALAEFRRVVRPGGLVAFKESDVTMWNLIPGPRNFIVRRYEALELAGDVRGNGALRSPLLPSWLRRAGLANVWRRYTLIERTPPFSESGRAFWMSFFQGIGAMPDDYLLPADREFSAQFRDPRAIERYLDDPDCCQVEGNILTVGTVPDRTQAGTP